MTLRLKLLILLKIRFILVHMAQDLKRGLINSISSKEKMILASLFFIWGLITQLNDLLIPFLFNIFELTLSQALMIHFTFFATYLVAAYPAGKLIDSLGYKKGIFYGLLILALGCFVYYAGIQVRNYDLVLIAMIIMGAGVTILQIAANGYVVLQSFPREAASNLNFIQVFNSFSRVCAFLFGSVILMSLANISPDQMMNLSPEAYRLAQANYVKAPYLIMAFLIIILALLFRSSKLPEFKTTGLKVLVKNNGREFTNLFQIKHLILGALAVFCCVGAEVAIGTNLIRYVTLPDLGGAMSDEKALKLVQYYWGSFMVGRVIGGFILKDVSPRKAVTYFALLATLFALISIFTTGNIAIVSIVAVGFFTSILFPTIFTLGINGLGHFAEEGSALMIGSIVGGALIPLLMVTLADDLGLHSSLIIAVVCYLYIAYYGMFGSKFQKEDSQSSEVI